MNLYGKAVEAIMDVNLDFESCSGLFSNLLNPYENWADFGMQQPVAKEYVSRMILLWLVAAFQTKKRYARLKTAFNQLRWNCPSRKRTVMSGRWTMQQMQKWFHAWWRYCAARKIQKSRRKKAVRKYDAKITVKVFQAWKGKWKQFRLIELFTLASNEQTQQRIVVSCFKCWKQILYRKRVVYIQYLKMKFNKCQKWIDFQGARKNALHSKTMLLHRFTTWKDYHENSHRKNKLCSIIARKHRCNLQIYFFIWLSDFSRQRKLVQLQKHVTANMLQRSMRIWVRYMRDVAITKKVARSEKEKLCFKMDHLISKLYSEFDKHCLCQIITEWRWMAKCRMAKLQTAAIMISNVKILHVTKYLQAWKSGYCNRKAFNYCLQRMLQIRYTRVLRYGMMKLQLHAECQTNHITLKRQLKQRSRCVRLTKKCKHKHELRWIFLVWANSIYANVIRRKIVINHEHRCAMTFQMRAFFNQWYQTVQKNKLVRQRLHYILRKLSIRCLRKSWFIWVLGAQSRIINNQCQYSFAKKFRAFHLSRLKVLQQQNRAGILRLVLSYVFGRWRTTFHLSKRAKKKQDNFTKVIQKLHFSGKCATMIHRWQRQVRHQLITRQHKVLVRQMVNQFRQIQREILVKNKFQLWKLYAYHVSKMLSRINKCNRMQQKSSYKKVFCNWQWYIQNFKKMRRLNIVLTHRNTIYKCSNSFLAWRQYIMVRKFKRQTLFGRLKLIKQSNHQRKMQVLRTWRIWHRLMKHNESRNEALLLKFQVSYRRYTATKYFLLWQQFKNQNKYFRSALRHLQNLLLRCVTTNAFRRWNSSYLQCIKAHEKLLLNSSIRSKCKLYQSILFCTWKRLAFRAKRDIVFVRWNQKLLRRNTQAFLFGVWRISCLQKKMLNQWKIKIDSGRTSRQSFSLLRLMVYRWAQYTKCSKQAQSIVWRNLYKNLSKSSFFILKRHTRKSKRTRTILKRMCIRQHYTRPLLLALQTWEKFSLVCALRSEIMENVVLAESMLKSHRILQHLIAKKVLHTFRVFSAWKSMHYIAISQRHTNCTSFSQRKFARKRYLLLCFHYWKCFVAENVLISRHRYVTVLQFYLTQWKVFIQNQIIRRRIILRVLRRTKNSRMEMHFHVWRRNSKLVGTRMKSLVLIWIRARLRCSLRKLMLHKYVKMRGTARLDTIPHKIYALKQVCTMRDRRISALQLVNAKVKRFWSDWKTIVLQWQKRVHFLRHLVNFSSKRYRAMAYARWKARTAKRKTVCSFIPSKIMLSYVLRMMRMKCYYAFHRWSKNARTITAYSLQHTLYQMQDYNSELRKAFYEWSSMAKRQICCRQNLQRAAAKMHLQRAFSSLVNAVRYESLSRHCITVVKHHSKIINNLQNRFQIWIVFTAWQRAVVDSRTIKLLSSFKVQATWKMFLLLLRSQSESKQNLAVLSLGKIGKVYQTKTLALAIQYWKCGTFSQLHSQCLKWYMGWKLWVRMQRHCNRSVENCLARKKWIAMQNGFILWRASYSRSVAYAQRITASENTRKLKYRWLHWLHFIQQKRQIWASIADYVKARKCLHQHFKVCFLRWKQSYVQNLVSIKSCAKLASIAENRIFHMKVKLIFFKWRWLSILRHRSRTALYSVIAQTMRRSKSSCWVRWKFATVKLQLRAECKNLLLNTSKIQALAASFYKWHRKISFIRLNRYQQVLLQDHLASIKQTGIVFKVFYQWKAMRQVVQYRRKRRQANALAYSAKYFILRAIFEQWKLWIRRMHYLGTRASILGRKRGVLYKTLVAWKTCYFLKVAQRSMLGRLTSRNAKFKIRRALHSWHEKTCVDKVSTEIIHQHSLQNVWIWFVAKLVQNKPNMVLHRALARYKWYKRKVKSFLWWRRFCLLQNSRRQKLNVLVLFQNFKLLTAGFHRYRERISVLKLEEVHTRKQMCAAMSLYKTISIKKRRIYFMHWKYYIFRHLLRNSAIATLLKKLENSILRNRWKSWVMYSNAKGSAIQQIHLWIRRGVLECSLQQWKLHCQFLYLQHLSTAHWHRALLHKHFMSWKSRWNIHTALMSIQYIYDRFQSNTDMHFRSTLFQKWKVSTLYFRIRDKKLNRLLHRSRKHCLQAVFHRWPTSNARKIPQQKPLQMHFLLWKAQISAQLLRNQCSVRIHLLLNWHRLRRALLMSTQDTAICNIKHFIAWKSYVQGVQFGLTKTKLLRRQRQACQILQSVLRSHNDVCTLHAWIRLKSFESPP